MPEPPYPDDSPATRTDLADGIGAAPASAGAGTPSPAGNLLFNGDRGALPLETRKALVNLLIGPTVEAELHPTVWATLLRDTEIIEQRLGDLFLALVLDRDRGVAFIRQVEAENLDFPILLRSAPLTFMDSTLLIVLREHLMRADNAGERAVVTQQELFDALDLFRKKKTPEKDSDFLKKCSASIEKMKDRNFLRSRRHGMEGWEISPMLRHLFQNQNVDALTAQYRELGVLSGGAPAAGGGKPAEDAGGDGDGPEECGP